MSTANRYDLEMSCLTPGLWAVEGAHLERGKREYLGVHRRRKAAPWTITVPGEFGGVIAKAPSFERAYAWVADWCEQGRDLLAMVEDPLTCLMCACPDPRGNGEVHWFADFLCPSVGDGDRRLVMERGIYPGLPIFDRVVLAQLDRRLLR